MVNSWDIQQALVDQAQVFIDTNNEFMLGLTDIKDATLGALDTVAEVRGGACETPPLLEGL